MKLIINDFAQVLSKQILNAERDIALCFYSVSAPNKHHRKTFTTIWRSLYEAAGRKIKIRLLLNHNKSGDRYAAHIEKQILLLRNVPFECRFHSMPATMHAKFAVFDSHHIYIGSHNLTPHGTQKNIEVGLLFESPKLAHELLILYNFMWEGANASV